MSLLQCWWLKIARVISLMRTLLAVRCSTSRLACVLLPHLSTPSSRMKAPRAPLPPPAAAAAAAAAIALLLALRQHCHCAAADRRVARACGPSLASDLNGRLHLVCAPAVGQAISGCVWCSAAAARLCSGGGGSGSAALRWISLAACRAESAECALNRPHSRDSAVVNCAKADQSNVRNDRKWQVITEYVRCL